MSRDETSLEPLEPLDPQLERLLAPERSAKPPVEALHRIASRLAFPPPAGPGGEHGVHGGGGGLRAGWFASNGALVATAAFVAGGVGGAAVHATLVRPGASQVVYVGRPAATSAPTVTTPAEGVTRAPPPASPVASVVAPPLAPRASSAVPSTLSAERALLEAARTDLSAGDAPHALARLDEHARRFAKPQLGEEREALLIQSLVAVGRYDDARATAARFRAAAPGSLFMPAIEASLASIP